MMWIDRGLDDHARKRKRRGTMRFALGALLAFMLIGSMAIGTSAQKEAGCDDISADLAQVRLEQNPSYATRAQLDPDGDGIACEDDELAERDSEGAENDRDERDGRAGEGIGGGGRTESGEGRGGEGLGGRPDSHAVDDMPAVGVGTATSGMLAAILAGALSVVSLGGAAVAHRRGRA